MNSVEILDTDADQAAGRLAESIRVLMERGGMAPDEVSHHDTMLAEHFGVPVSVVHEALGVLRRLTLAPSEISRYKEDIERVVRKVREGFLPLGLALAGVQKLADQVGVPALLLKEALRWEYAHQQVER